MKESTSFPAILYHKDLAREGKLFQSAEHVPNDPLWVDTPQKFDPTYRDPEPLDSDEEVGELAAAKGFVPVAYPAHLFRKGDPDNPTVVANADAHRALEAAEPGIWKETYNPAAWADAEAPRRPKGSVPAASAAPVPPPDQPAAAVPVTLTDDQRASFYKATVSQIAVQLESVGSPAEIAALLDAEAANPTKTRVGVVKALKARAAILTTAAE